MNSRILINKKEYLVDLSKPIDISLPLREGASNPNCYYSDHVEFEVIRKNGFTGSVEGGGSVNHKKVHFSPHGNGTHTECYGHISPDKTTINSSLIQFHFPAQLASIKPEIIDRGDQVITLKSFIKSYPEINFNEIKALVIRTLPNDTAKKSRSYSGTNPPYFEPLFLKFLADQEVEHLLVDLPSVDREEDGGKLLSHKAFWNYPEKVRKNSTITELIYVPDEVEDGIYLLNLQISSFEMDAAPSKPVLYKID